MRKDIQRLAAWAAALFTASIILGLLAAIGATDGFDKTLFKAIALREASSPDIAIAVAEWLSWWGTASPRLGVTIVAAVWLAWCGRTRAALVMLVIPPLSDVASTILKQAFGRMRPELVPHLEIIDNPAYTSGHATLAACVYILLALLIPGLRPRLTMTACICVAFLIGLSRIWLGVHWPTDVIGGWMLGTGFAMAGLAVARHFEGQKRR